MLEKITREEFYLRLDSFLTSREDKTLYWIYDKVAVNYGNQNDCNIDWCKEHEILVNNAHRGGGCIVSVPGNINLVDIRDFNGHTWLGSEIMKDFAEYLCGRGLNAVYDRNDVMVDGFKVASAVSMNLKPSYIRQYTGAQFSIDQDLEIIQNVCLKKMIKQPKGLKEFGIKTEDVESWINKYFNVA